VASPRTKISFVPLYLASFAPVKDAAKAFVASAKRLDMLCLDAAILGAPAGQTKEGYEIHVGTNHVGHALLLRLLTPTRQGYHSFVFTAWGRVTWT
jgi:NAD(P)-dependent dehydrogenase (short-subunit alcohol dehydrogenase family)